MARALAGLGHGVATPGSCAVEASQATSSTAGLARSVRTSALAAAPVDVRDEIFNRQRSVLPLEDRVPEASPDSWVAPSAIVVGDVDLFDKVVVWYKAVLRGDLAGIKIGYCSTIGEGAVLHAARSVPTGLSADTWLEKYVQIGPRAVLRSCHIEEQVRIGARSVIMEGARVCKGAHLQPGTVVPPGRLIPEGEVWGGNPARYVRDLLPHEQDIVKRENAEIFNKVARMHHREFTPSSLAYIEAARVRRELAQKGLYDDTPHCAPPDAWYPYEYQRAWNTSGGM